MKILMAGWHDTWGNPPYDAGVGQATYLWTSTDDGSIGPYRRWLTQSDVGVYRFANDASRYWIGVRCVAD